MTKKRKVLIGVGIVVVIAVIIGFSVNARRKDKVLVETDKVKRKAELIALVSATGEIKPKEYVELQAEISGVITDLFVNEGDLVEKDSLLLKIDPVQTRADTRAQEALLAAVQSEARNQQAQISVQRTNIERDVANVRLVEVEVENASQNLSLVQEEFRSQTRLVQGQVDFNRSLRQRKE